jgi:predicted Zn-dependent protease
MKQVFAFLLLATAVALPGCATNPATGGTTFTGGFGASQEIAMGRQSHPEILKEFGGEYANPALKAYVDSIGQLLARTVERHDYPYTFTVLNSSVTNAFAVPGGYIYITRGLLALADDEAELACVLAHELGHLNALHHAQRQGQTLLANILVTGAAIATGSEAIGQTGGVLATGVLRGFSREQETEADELGIRYASRAGYDVTAMARFLGKLRAESQLEAKRHGKSPDEVDRFNYLATHPAPIERMQHAAQVAGGVSVRDPMTARDVYLSKIDGMLYGDDPDDGIVRGREFVHPGLRLRFEAPPGFSLFNRPKSVTAIGPQGAGIIFDQAPAGTAGSPAAYLTAQWGRNLRLSGVERIDVNGMEAATATARANTQSGPRDVRLLAVRADARTIYRFLFVTPPALTERLSADFRRTTYSFRRLAADEAAATRPLRIRVIAAGVGDTPQTLAARMPQDGYAPELFQVLNGVPARPGEKLKIVAP